MLPWKAYLTGYCTAKHHTKFSIVWVTFNTRRIELFYIASTLLLTKADLSVGTYLQSLSVLIRNPIILVHPIIQGALCLVPSHLSKCMFICTADRKTRPWMNQIWNIAGFVHKSSSTDSQIFYQFYGLLPNRNNRFDLHWQAYRASLPWGV